MALALALALAMPLAVALALAAVAPVPALALGPIAPAAFVEAPFAAFAARLAVTGPAAPVLAAPVLALVVLAAVVAMTVPTVEWLVKLLTSPCATTAPEAASVSR